MKVVKMKNIKKTILWASMLLVSLFSCKEDLTRRNKALIIGEWYPIEDVESGEEFHMNGYGFDENGIVENKLGFIEYYYPEGYDFTYPFRILDGDYRLYYEIRNIIRFHGNFSTYTIDNDTLKIFDPSIKEWSTQTISFLSNDTLLLTSTNDSIKQKFTRKIYELDNSRLFDQIIFYFPQWGEYNSCEKFFSIDCSGTFIYSERDALRNRIFTGTIKDGEFDRLELLFKKADLLRVISEVDSLQNSDTYYQYRSGLYMPPPFHNYVTFVSENKLFTIEDPFREISLQEKEFFWAYLSGLYFPEQVQFVPETLHNQERIFSDFNDFHNLRIEKPDSALDLYHTERFYLNILLQNATLTDTVFEPLYILKESISSKDKIETDGRYFKYKTAGVAKTLDIGFNFIKENNFQKLFRERTNMEKDWLNASSSQQRIMLE